MDSSSDDKRLPYERHPLVEEQQAALSAASEERQNANDELLAARASLTTRPTRESLEALQALEHRYEHASAVEAMHRESVHVALRHAIKELYPELVAAQDLEAARETERQALEAEIAESIACADAEEHIALLREAHDGKQIEVNRARRDIRKLVQKHGLG